MLNLAFKTSSLAEKIFNIRGKCLSVLKKYLKGKKSHEVCVLHKLIHTVEALNLPADNHCKSPYNCMCIISVRHNCRIFMKSPNKGGGGRGEEGRGGGKG